MEIENVKLIPEYIYVETLFRYYGDRLAKAKSLNLMPNSSHYKAYLELGFRYQELKDVLSYMEKLATELEYPKIVESASSYVAEQLSRCHIDRETNPDISELSLSESQPYKQAIDYLCLRMNSFRNYEASDPFKLYVDTLSYIVAGINLWITYREEMFPLNKKKEVSEC